MSYRYSTIWPLDPHTDAKHRVLRNYLNAWLPIMSSWNGRIVYIDGFAGPGIYKGGEDGSPIIALNAALEHRFPIRSEVVFYFIELDEDRCRTLEGLLRKISIPPNFKVVVKTSRFDEHLTDVLNALDEQKARLAPTFAFIDPFGYSHTPFTVVKRLMSNPRCEVLITFMYEEINRFWDLESHKDHLDQIFGCERPSLVNIQSPDERRKRIHDLYMRQLSRAAEIKFVRSFEMINMGNRTDYFLIFGTRNRLGLIKMKEAMWRVDPTGTFQFSDATANPNQPTLFSLEPDFAGLGQSLMDVFLNQGEVDIKDIEGFVIEETPFLTSHIRRRVLKPFEQEGRIEVVSSPRRKPLSYPPGTVIRFLH